MSESETETRGPERPNKPALPPFRGPGAATGPVLRPSTDLRGRKTLPPFVARPVRVGGPLPGAAPHPAIPAAAPPPEAQATVVTPAQAEIRAPTATPERPITPPAPSWDTPAMPLAAAPGASPGPVGMGSGIPATVPTVEAEWASPVSDPHPRRAVEEGLVDAPSASAAAVADVVPARDTHEEVGAPDLTQGTTTTDETSAHETAAPGASDAPIAASEGLIAAAADGDLESASGAATLPPTLFEDPPLSALPSMGGDATSPASDLAHGVRSDDITDMFATPYDAGPPMQPPAPPVKPPATSATPRRAARKTPALGAARLGQTGTLGGRAQTAARIGRRVTPVLSQAITPMNVPAIRRTPVAPSTALERAPVPPPASMQAAPLSPTPIAVPVLQDIGASRAVAHALETVAARVRAGQIVIAGQVPIGDDVGALAAAVAAALGALLGVQR